MIRAATIWVIWLARNKVCFQHTVVPSSSSLGLQIIALTSFWCKVKLDDTFFKLTLILPMDVSFLNQAGLMIINSDSSTQNSPLNSENTDPGSGLKGSNLSEYLRIRAKMDDIDAAFESIGNQGVLVQLSSTSESAGTSSSSIDSSVDPT